MDTSVLKIAGGVFLGNLLFAVLAWFVASTVMENMRTAQAIRDLPIESAAAQASLDAAMERLCAADAKKCAEMKAEMGR